MFMTIIDRIRGMFGLVNKSGAPFPFNVDPLNWWFWIVLAITAESGVILLKNL